MKYLQLYERYGRKTFQEWLENPPKWKPSNYLKTKDGATINYHQFFLTEMVKNQIANNILNITEISCSENALKSLEGIEKFKNLKKLYCRHCNLDNLKGIENLKKLEILYCGQNDLKNLDEVKNLPNIKKIYAVGNDFDYPIPIEIFDKCCLDEKGRQIAYSSFIEQKFKSYDFQKEFLTKFPEKIFDLKPLGFNPKIKEEFPQFASIFRGTEWGFFDLERSSK